MILLRWYRARKLRRRALAMHEATHAVVAMRLGLPVLWASIIPGYDEEEKQSYPAAVKIRDEASQDQLLVLAATAAPSFVLTGDEAIDQYAAFEATLAYTKAEKAGLDPRAVRRIARAEAFVPQIERLTRELLEDGHVELAA